jgi:hypothetical protein
MKGVLSALSDTAYRLQTGLTELGQISQRQVRLVQIYNRRLILKSIILLSSKPKQKYSDSRIILNISNMFIKIYNQALEAECYRLNLICGTGYRKAFEYLIKDYAVYIINEVKRRSFEKCFNVKLPPFISLIDEDEKMRILEMPLAKVIREYIDDNYIKELAKRAVWLGNDETHIVRKWEFDLSGLKNLIDLTVEFIENRERFKIVVKKIPDKN